MLASSSSSRLPRRPDLKEWLDLGRRGGGGPAAAFTAGRASGPQTPVHCLSGKVLRTDVCRVGLTWDLLKTQSLVPDSFLNL